VEGLRKDSGQVACWVDWYLDLCSGQQGGQAG